ncbi:MAG: MBL fold metallo-hydrolase [Polyangiaceae bacterium]|jgi:phosphoribosyl 1,2-cyclic phosphodiesterase|nr:MBL fold metallo-hydrolase [Polyangiaceae bacterium]
MQVTILASGSKGNATLFRTESAAVLVDAGTTFARVSAHTPRLDAIVLTHAHTDHVGQYARLARKLKARVHASEATARALRHPEGVVTFGAREAFHVGNLRISPIPLPHDAAQVGLVIASATRSVALITDLGEVPPGLIDHLRGCDTLLVESNHDMGMLIEGPYPKFLKQRIASAKGHLSNDQLGALLRAHYRDARFFGERGARSVVLMHLSEVNNRPDLAFEQARACLPEGVRLQIASQTEPLDVPEEPFSPGETPGETSG